MTQPFRHGGLNKYPSLKNEVSCLQLETRDRVDGPQLF